MPPKGAKDKKDAKNKDLPAHLRDGYAKFRLPNDDRYEGEFQANNKTMTIYRHGLGTYRTWDGHTYTAMWDNDMPLKGSKLQIEFADQSTYTGLVSPTMDYLSGTYRFHDGCSLKCRFGKSSLPVQDDQLVFTDPRGQVWDVVLEQQYLRVRLPFRFGLDGDKRVLSDEGVVLEPTTPKPDVAV